MVAKLLRSNVDGESPILEEENRENTCIVTPHASKIVGLMEQARRKLSFWKPP